MVEFGQNRRAKRYALEIFQWLDGILKDDSIEESIKYEMNNTVEGLTSQIKDLKKKNEEYKSELEELNSKVSEMSEFLNLKTKLQDLSRSYEEYRSESEKKIFHIERSNQELLEEKTRIELKCKGLEEGNLEVLAKNEDLIKEMDKKTRELEQKTVEGIKLEESRNQRELDLKLELENQKKENQELEARILRMEEKVNNQKEELEQKFSKDLNERELKIQSLNEECKHNKYRITELEKLLKMAENEQLVSKNYRSLIEQYKNRLHVLENSEKSYLELQEKWTNQEKLFKQQSQKLEQAEGWLKRMVELEQENSTLSQSIKQWETMALRYTHNLKVLNKEGSTSIKDLNEEGNTDHNIDHIDTQDNFKDGKIETSETYSGSQQGKKSISPTTVLSAIFEFQRRYQDVLVSKTVIESSKAELENKVDILEGKLQVCQRELKFYEDELNSKSSEIQEIVENNKRLECEIKVLKECLGKESKTKFAVQSQSGSDRVNEGVSDGENSEYNRFQVGGVSGNSGDTDTVWGKQSKQALIEAHRQDLEEKTKIITHLESELRLRNEEIKTYWSIRVAYDTLTQERDSLLETSNSLQNHNSELKSQIIALNDKIKLFELSAGVGGDLKRSPRSVGSSRVGEAEKRGLGGMKNEGTIMDEESRKHVEVGLGETGNGKNHELELNDSSFKDKYYEERRRSQILSEYYIKERSNLMDAISNILGWRIEITYVEGGLTAYKLSSIFSSHGGELIFVIRPAPTLEGGNSTSNNGISSFNAMTTTFLLTSDNLVSETEVEEQLTLDFIGYYANKFEEDSNWALQLTATQSYPAFMAYTCLEEFHSSNIQAITEDNEEGGLNHSRAGPDSGSSREPESPPEGGGNENLGTKTKRLREDTSWIRQRD
ncbi:hypothetical protein HWI79_1249 [Cryptosporidium felis]|nr:hypothetical protein HWI79_1249 [Cryptosporidium felis]